MTDTVPGADELGAIDAALDRLLDPLEDLLPSAEAAPAEAAPAAPAAPAAAAARAVPAPAPAPARVVQVPVEPFVVERGGSSLRSFFARLRWSERSFFRIPRLIASWAVVALAFWSVVWLIFASGMLR